MSEFLDFNLVLLESCQFMLLVEGGNGNIYKSGDYYNLIW